jgi:hypothetical protein
MILEGCYQTKLNDQLITIQAMSLATKQAEQQLLANSKAAHYRFFSSRESLLISSQQTDLYRDKSSKSRLGFVASCFSNGQESQIGSCYLDLLQQTQACELSVSLSAEWLNLGAAKILCQKALEFAHERGVREFYYQDLPANCLLAMELGLISVVTDDSTSTGINKAFIPNIVSSKAMHNSSATLLVSTRDSAIPLAL